MFERKLTGYHSKYMRPTGSVRWANVGGSAYLTTVTNVTRRMGGFTVRTDSSAGGKDGL